MGDYRASNGSAFTDDDVERWAQEAEAGFVGAVFGDSSPGSPAGGRPVTVGSDARPFTFRLDAARRAKLDVIARERAVSVSQLVRDLIDAL